MSRAIAFATDQDHATLTQDDQRVAVCAAALGITISPAIWNDPNVIWERFDAVVIRSCWDYHLHPTAFLDWVDRLEQGGYYVMESARHCALEQRQTVSV